MSFLSAKTVNSGRQAEVDLLRGFTAIVLIICHVGLYLGNSDDRFLWTFSDIIGSEPCAPVFMALMGISMIYSRHREPGQLLKRGGILFLSGYVLSFFRSILPLLVLGPVDEWTSAEAFFVVDILQFAGLSFLFIALLKKLRFPNIAILAVSLVMVIADQFIMLPDSIPWDSELITGIVNLFCPVTQWSCFPFLTWFAFPAFGLFFGELLQHCNNKKKLYGILLPVSFAGVMYIFYQFYTLYPDYTSYYWGHNFYYMGLKNVLLTVLVICLDLSFWFFTGKILPGFIRRFLCFLSRNLNTYYIISWIIISLLIHVQAIFGWKLNTPASMGVTALLTAVCAVLTWLWLSVKRFALKKTAAGAHSDGKL